MLTSAGLPPLGGFVSEWLLLQSFLFTPGLPDALLNMLIPAAAALVALVAALAGYTMVKFFGVIFLGQPREEKLAQAHDAGAWERVGMLWLVLGCVVLGLLPVQFIQLIDPVTQQLIAAGLGRTVADSGWLLAPISVERASYGPVIFLLGVAGQLAGSRSSWCAGFYHGRLRRVAGVGLRLPVAERAHAGHGRRLRAADPPDLRAVLRDAPRAAHAFRRAARATASWSRTTSGAGSICRWRQRPRASPGWSACCSRAAFPSTCSTAS